MSSDQVQNISKLVKGRRLVVWIQLDPGQHIIGEGIGQHLANLLKGFIELDLVDIEICAPIWTKKKFRFYLRSFGISSPRIKVKFFGQQFLYKILGQPKQYFFPKTDAESVRDALVTTRRKWLWAPAAVMASLQHFRTSRDHAAAAAAPSPKAIKTRIRGFLDAILRMTTYGEMAAYVDTDPTVIAAIVPLGNWSTARLLKDTPFVPQIPDLVFLEFPDSFDRRKDVNAVAMEIKRTADRAGSIVTVSDHVAKHHLQDFMSIPAEKIFVVKHGPMMVNQYIEAFAKRAKVPVAGLDKKLAKRFLRKRLIGEKVLELYNNSLFWLSQARSEQVWEKKVIFFPTQARPYKNIKRLIQAVNILKLEENIDCVLFLTGDISQDKVIQELIESSNLYSNIVLLPRLNPVMHGVFYSVADLVVSASLFEGGFPFLFSEALSVNTPVVMARTPVTIGELPSQIEDLMMFDPLDARDIARKMKAALENNDLLPQQLDIWKERYATNGWREVALGYLSACVSASERRSNPRS